MFDILPSSFSFFADGSEVRIIAGIMKIKRNQGSSCSFGTKRTSKFVAYLNGQGGLEG
jgi:hypothetical protein